MALKPQQAPSPLRLPFKVTNFVLIALSTWSIPYKIQVTEKLHCKAWLAAFCWMQGYVSPVSFSTESRPCSIPVTLL